MHNLRDSEYFAKAGGMAREVANEPRVYIEQ
jgi:hypothetical protein